MDQVCGNKPGVDRNTEYLRISARKFGRIYKVCKFTLAITQPLVSKTKGNKDDCRLAVRTFPSHIPVSCHGLHEAALG